MAKPRPVSNPGSYVAPQSAARMLRELAGDLDQRDPDEWVSLRINSYFASRAEVEHSMKKKPEVTNERQGNSSRA